MSECLTGCFMLQNARKTRHYVASPQHFAKVLNEFLLSPLSKIISC